MNGSEFNITTIIFAALAIFVVWKLRSVLGQRHDHEDRGDQARPDRPGRGRPAEREGNVVRLPGAGSERSANGAEQPHRTEKRWEGLAEKGSAVWEGLDKLDAAERGFDAHMFADGAKGAYEMIVTAFAAGDKATLRNLLSREVLDSFAQVISERDSRGEQVETTFVSLDKSRIEDVQIRGKTANITVAFDSQMITATYDKNRQLVDGDPEKIVSVSDVWTFARDIGSNDPNWRLVAT
ncbi:MAG: Tim44 domain-containing protein [Hyphomicrobiales bacterium]|nr:Tim44 domain-containing protein [Hyphomicrobiales bacterium]